MPIIKFPSIEVMRNSTESRLIRIVRLLSSLPARLLLALALPVLFASFFVCSVALSVIGKLMGEKPRSLNFSFGDSHQD